MAGAIAGAHLGVQAIPKDLLAKLETSPKGRAYLFDLADGLWQERQQAGPLQLYPHLLGPLNNSWRTLAYFAIRLLLLPYYRILLNRDMRWLSTLKNKLKYSLLRGVRHE